MYFILILLKKVLLENYCLLQKVTKTGSFKAGLNLWLSPAQKMGSGSTGDPSWVRASGNARDNLNGGYS
jgi:hypothetical protein